VEVQESSIYGTSTVMADAYSLTKDSFRNAL